ncbi:hypothetical protein [Cohnella sp. CFH 77786]|uniref:hypothetical protein n=1 Tax=Cohnella sp. CFH 77786 TaxID=2662265 RepID=UPI001C6104C8|nr:hypothetical protein [Cohnella sp. CFH 77786]
MRAPIRKSLRKWAVGVGCTLSIALLLQNIKNSDAFQGAQSAATDSPSLAQEDSSTRDPVMQEWQDQSQSSSLSDPSAGGSPSGFGDRIGRSDTGSGFRSRSGQS